jgi:hypothetical protein
MDRLNERPVTESHFETHDGVAVVLPPLARSGHHGVAPW